MDQYPHCNEGTDPVAMKLDVIFGVMSRLESELDPHCGQLLDSGGPDPILILKTSVADPDPPDPHVFGPIGSGSTSQRYGSGSGSCSGSGSGKVISRKNCDNKLVFCWHLEGQRRK
jgi:hypothetical protein